MNWRSTISMTIRDACRVTGLVPEDVTALVAEGRLQTLTMNGKVFVVTRSLLKLVEGAAQSAPSLEAWLAAGKPDKHTWWDPEGPIRGGALDPNAAERRGLAERAGDAKP